MGAHRDFPANFGVYGLDTDKLRDHVQQRMAALRIGRMSWWNHWREIADYLLPSRYEWLVQPNKANRGSPINQKIINNTGTLAWRTLASGMMSGITSPARPWFKMTLADTDLAEQGEVKLWLDECTRRIGRIFASSNFYNGIATVYGDLGSFGTAPMIIYGDFQNVIRCYNPCAGEYYLDVGPGGNVDTIYREYVQTAYQLAREFGVENCSETVQSAVRDGGARLQMEVLVCHAIEPNDELLPGMIGMRGMPYREVYWEPGSNNANLLRVQGFHEFPGIAPRWDVTGNNAYGRSPAMDALGDIKQLQTMERRAAQAIDKMVNPPVVADPVLQNKPASMLPGGVTYTSLTNGNAGVRPIYEINPRLAEFLQKQQACEQRIDQTFFKDLFLMISQLESVRTATEIDARKEEKLIQLGPMLERFQNEALDPAIDRTFNLLLRARLLPPIPQALRGQNIEVKYVSMLSQAQNAAQTASLERFAQFVGNIAGAVPDALDNVDWDELINEYAEMLDVPPKNVVPLAKVMQIRAAKQKQQAAAAASQNALAAVQGAQVLSNTDVGGGQNALQKVIGAA